MDKSVAELNIEHYRKLLSSADLDETKRKTVENLLAAEEQKLAQIKSERAAAKTSRPANSASVSALPWVSTAPTTTSTPAFTLA